MKKKLAYLFWAIVCIAAAFEGLFGDMDGTSIGMKIFLAIVFVLIAIYLFGKFKDTPANTPESSQEAPSEAPTAETAPITHADTNDGVEDDYVAIDIETTGLGRDARIIELGAVRVRHGRKVASFSQLVNPQIPIPAKVTQITGITDRDVKGKPTIDKALPRFYAFCGKDTWIGHNIHRFDIPIIKHEAERIGAGIPDVNFYDTLEISQVYLPQLEHHRLKDLIRYFGIAKNERHRAADDAAQTAQIFECLKRLSESA